MRVDRAGFEDELRDMIELESINISKLDRYKEARPINTKKYIEAITNPSTPAEVAMALSDQNSPLYKLLMKLIDENIAEEVLLLRLVEHWIEQKNMEASKEQEALLKENAAASRLAEKQLQEYVLQLSKSITHKIEENKSLPELKQLILSLPQQIQQLQQQANIIQQSIQQLAQQRTVINQNIAQRRQQINQQVISLLQQQMPPNGPLAMMRVGGQLQPINAAQLAAVLNRPQPLFDVVMQRSPGLAQNVVNNPTKHAVCNNCMEQFSHMLSLNGGAGDDWLDHKKFFETLKQNHLVNKAQGPIYKKNVDAYAKDLGQLANNVIQAGDKKQELDTTNNTIGNLEVALEAAKEQANRLEKKAAPQ